MILAFIWGWSFLFIKVAVQGMTPATVAWARVALGAAVMLVVLRARRTALPPRSERTQWRHFVVLAVTYNAVPFTLLAWAEQHISSALAAVLNASTPLFAAVLTAVLLGER
jgi:drug/metabolite transporter (DMT)-like permease